MDLLCPNSPYVWNETGLSPCFENLVLGFGANVLGISVVIALALAKRNTGRAEPSIMNWQLAVVEKMSLHVVPAVGACLCFYNIFLLIEGSYKGQRAEYHEWLYKVSQLFSWAIIVLVSKFENWYLIVCNLFLCFWWIAKPLLEIPHLQTVFSSSKVKTHLMEVLSVATEIMFGIFITTLKAMRSSSIIRNFNSVEDPLISSNIDNKCSTGGLEQNSCSFWETLTFKFANSMLDLGAQKQLDFEDLVQLPNELVPSCHNSLLRCWMAEKCMPKTDRSLLIAMFHAYGWPYLRLGLLKMVNDGIGFLSPLILNKLIQFLQKGSDPIHGYILAFSLGLTSIFKSFMDTQYTFRLSKLRLELRSSIMTMIYHKCLHVSLAERSKFSEGEIQTFMSIDAGQTVNICNSIHDTWSLPLQIGVALYLLYTQVGYAFVSGLAITILLIPVNKWISTMIARATEKMLKEKDERIRGAGELLMSIRILKMYSWERIFTERLMKRRLLEVQHLSTRKYLDAWCVFFWATTPTLFSLSTFGVFSLMGQSLDAATVFTCVALFNTLISPLNSFPWVINGLIDAVISSRRLSKFLSCPEHSFDFGQSCDAQITLTDPIHHFGCQHSLHCNPNMVIFQDSCFVWSSFDDPEEQSPVLRNVTLNLPNGLFIAIVGEVGSGKSSLLNSILGEMRLIHGCMHSCGSTAYVPQVPWIQSGSVRDNILFGEEMIIQRYGEVLHACALDADISRMAGGDLAYIGEKGLNLSGGQRARLALARAIYRNSELYLLDDVLSAVDSHVANWVLSKALLGPLTNQKTRVLCTHNAQAIASADLIVVMDKGNVRWIGSFHGFLSSPYSTISMFKNSKISSVELSGEKSIASDLDEITSYMEQGSDYIVSMDQTQDAAELEFRKEGRVEFDVYKSYATFVGWPLVVLIALSAIFMQASRNGNDLWLSYWVDARVGTDYTAFYLVHLELLSKIVNAPVQFFDRNPSGRILNRFSSDLYMIDDSLPFILNILLANLLSLVGIAVVLSYAQIVVLLLIFPFWYIYRKIQFYYRSTSRELRRLDSVSRSPIYSSFTETLDGSSTIRALKSEDFFMAKFSKHVALYQKTSYSEITASLWLSLRLQLLAAFIISFIALMAVIGNFGDFPFKLGTPGLVGLALSYASPIVSLLSSFLTSFTETEKEMVSVERVLQYIDIPQEEQCGSVSPHLDWPSHGQIEFEHVTLRYKPSLPAALNNLSFKINAGLQVGVVGRTGAGKSSMINALFRLTPICNGRILVDNLNVAEVSVRELRQSFAVVPQSPFLFEGSLRDNLDPSGGTSEEKMWEILEKVHIRTLIESAGGLDIQVKESTFTFSVGQCQLICLARALLKSSKILFLDECTANVDTQTASVLQNTISNECRGMTVITIAHRISVVLNMDYILVLDNGVLVEQGNPRALLKDSCSRFSGFARASYSASINSCD
ncbi:hypothetical protein M5K25_027971 [Dendrobium thyrsiflorum]|uniref:ABC-type xenobiotic transporter n=1 Tax=Dendrobium thyrsiflorum TaxID=117978 RepID=A0ABD0TV79_DENTH